MTYVKLYQDAQIAVARLIDKYEKDSVQYGANYNPLFIPFEQWKSVHDDMVGKKAVLRQMLTQLDRMRRHSS